MSETKKSRASFLGTGVCLSVSASVRVSTISSDALRPSPNEPVLVRKIWLYAECAVCAHASQGQRRGPQTLWRTQPARCTIP